MEYLPLIFMQKWSSYLIIYTYFFNKIMTAIWHVLIFMKVHVKNVLLYNL